MFYESIKGATCKLGSIEKLYAFSYEPPAHREKISMVGTFTTQKRNGNGRASAIRVSTEVGEYRRLT